MKKLELKDLLSGFDINQSDPISQQEILGSNATQ